jgi:hypothetical protein
MYSVIKSLLFLAKIYSVAGNTTFILTQQKLIY